MTLPESEPRNLVQRIVQWLRAGYPEGVPQQDYVALLGILRRSLTEAELTRVVGELADEAPGQPPTPEVVVRRIRDVVKGPVEEQDVLRVSARLAAVGWPLGSPLSLVADDASAGQARPGLVGRVVGWLREGYPAGLPDRDFVPLVALLRRRLTDAEVREVGALLAEEGMLPADRIDIGTVIARITSELPSQDDVARVRAYLGEHGWPRDLEV